MSPNPSIRRSSVKPWRDGFQPPLARVESDQAPEVMPQKAADAVQGDSVPTSAEAQPFPASLEGFDLSDGLQRLQGNKVLYRKLLMSFAASYTRKADDIRHALDAGDYHEAHKIIHDIKGLAGNLAAFQLQAAAAELEKLVKHADKENPPSPDAVTQHLIPFETRMDQALRSAQTLKSSTAGPGPAPSA